MAISSVGGNGMYADSTKTESTTRNSQAPASSSLTMENFMLLLASELQNQDMSSPMSNAEMMQQLTSMATVQSMNTFSELSSTQYALSLMGEKVKVASTNETTGKMEMKEGEIAGVNLSTMKLYLKGSDVAYGLGNIMEVGDVPEPKKDDKKDPTKPDGSGDGDGSGAGDNSKTNNSQLSRMASYTANPGTSDNSAAGAAASQAADESSRTDPVTGRTARRVTRSDSTESGAAAPGTSESKASESKAAESRASAPVSYGTASGGKTYTDTRSLRLEYLASDKREALERQRQHEIPEDKRAVLADRSAAYKATGPAAENYSKAYAGTPVKDSAKTSAKNTTENITLDPRRV